MKKAWAGQRGITIPEVLFVVSIVLVVASVVLPAVFSYRNYLNTRRGYSQIRVLFSAAKQMNAEYRAWPTYQAREKSDVHYGESLPNAYVMNILLAVDGEGNEGHVRNPQKMNFVNLVGGSVGDLQLTDSGEVLDPWGTPYQFVFDANYDNICTAPTLDEGSIYGTGVIIWSCGPDRTSDTRDDLRTWVH